MGITRWLRKLLGGLGLAAILASPAAAVPTIEYSDGEAEIGVAYEDSELELHYHFHSGAMLKGVTLSDEEEYAPDEVYVRVPSSLLESRPADPDYNFIGVGAGGNFWRLPQENVMGVPFFGTAAEETDPLDWTNDSFTYTVTAVSGPVGSHFSIFEVDGFGNPNVLAATSDGLPDTFQVPAGSHNHYNWGFTAEGVYEVEITAAGTHLTDGPVSDAGTFWFAVGDATQVIPEPTALTLVAMSCGLLLLKRRRAM